MLVELIIFLGLILLCLAMITLFVIISSNSPRRCKYFVKIYFICACLACFLVAQSASQGIANFSIKYYFLYLVLNFILPFILTFFIFNIPSFIFCVMYSVKFKKDNFFEKFYNYLRNLF